jgi:predicted lipid-binding transport protein (Tim44 family)
MKSFWSLFTTVFLLLALVQPAEAGKKFGGGGFGKSFSTAPAQKKSAAPSSTQKDQPGVSNAQPAGKTAGSKSGLMGGMLGGLLAGGMFAYLLGSGAFDGIQFMDILLLALVGFVLFKLFAGRRPQPQSQPQAAGHQRHEPFQAAASEPDTVAQRNDLSAMMTQTGNEAPVNLPDDFDQIAFIGGALDHYRQVQQAWNDGDMNTIKEYVAPELYAELAQQRTAMADAPPQTEVLDLAADIVRAEQDGSVRQISVLFRGRSRDNGDHSEDGIFDTWHLERDMSIDNAPWLVVGIEAD